ncbi:MAG: stage 0 sporulation family protein [Clostridia bacterium]|nr:stage 0 sporulation family protein [Clostridia bacterium]
MPKSEKSSAEKTAQAGKKRFPGDKIKPTEGKPAPEHFSDEYEEYTLTVEDDTTSAWSAAGSEEADVPKTEVVGIRFKSTGKVYYFDPKGRKYTKGSSAIVDTARGQEFGEVAMTNSMVRSADIVPPLRPVIRPATTADVEHHKSNKQKEDEAFRICNEKIAAHKLDMKLIDAQYTFDNSKLLFYFTSSDRVDFRNLVKDLASVFRTRIELRQIGIRDEAKLMGGLGMCGRPLCCTLFLSDFDQVSIKMAKEQNLSLNSAKISGICGRLMCCLRYEHEAYEYEIKRTPPVDSLVRTENGDGIVTEISPLQGTIKVRLLGSPEIPPKTYKRDEVTMLRKKQTGDNK